MDYFSSKGTFILVDVETFCTENYINFIVNLQNEIGEYITFKVKDTIVQSESYYIKSIEKIMKKNINY